MKVIKERKEFQISIRDVIFATRKVKLSNSVIPFSIRASKGTEIHQLFQNERKNTENSFQREVLVKFQIKIQGWKFTISGRADIIYENKGFLVIEEIKSVTNLDDFDLESETSKEYRRQLLLYGHYFLQLGKKIQCHLVLIDIFTEETKIIDVPHEDMSEYLIKQCETILNEWEMAQKFKAEQ